MVIIHGKSDDISPQCFIYAITVYLLRRFSPNFNVQISNIDNYCSNFIVRHDSVQKISHI